MTARGHSQFQGNTQAQKEPPSPSVYATCCPGTQGRELEDTLVPGSLEDPGMLDDPGHPPDVLVSALKNDPLLDDDPSATLLELEDAGDPSCPEALETEEEDETVNSLANDFEDEKSNSWINGCRDEELHGLENDFP